MMGLNRCDLIGNVARDPEIRTTANGSRVANFTVATSEQWNDKDNKKKTSTEFHKIVAWGGLVGVIEKYVRKGALVHVVGKIQTHTYERDGQKHYMTEIVLQGPTSELRMLDRPTGETPKPQPTSAPPREPARDEENDMPF